MTSLCGSQLLTDTHHLLSQFSNFSARKSDSPYYIIVLVLVLGLVLVLVLVLVLNGFVTTTLSIGSMRSF
jgi:hypothetical protein